MDKSNNKCGCGCSAEIKGGKCSGCGKACDSSKHASSEQSRGGKEEKGGYQKNQFGSKQSK